MSRSQIQGFKIMDVISMRFFMEITFEHQKLFILLLGNTRRPSRVKWSCVIMIYTDGQLPCENGKSNIVYNEDMNEVHPFLINHMVISS